MLLRKNNPLALGFARFLLVCCALVWCQCSHGADVVVLDKSTGSALEAAAAAKFYGLHTSTYDLLNPRNVALGLKAIRQKDTLAVVATAASLSALDPAQLLLSLKQGRSRYVPLLVTEISPQTQQGLLRKWSGGTVAGCQEHPTANPQLVYRVEALAGFTRQLSGLELPAGSGSICTLTITRPAEVIIALSSSSRELPSFIRTIWGKQELYFSAHLAAANPPVPSLAYDESQYQFSAMAPVLMFLRYAAGDRAWHSNGHYANLTIDDVWLREPYGHVTYLGLLREMQAHNFHTTIAFIPWNFDRSEPSVVSLFRTHPERLSVCIHGNNHDHQEFRSLKERSLDLQTANIRQALARMERFHSLTQISYDRIMVFPHSIAPAETLQSLKHSNFLATANSRNIPLDSDPPLDPAFSLRPLTLNFGNFPSLRRYSAEEPIDKSELSVDAFLENPILFYVHEAYFSEGINRFDSVADMVNELQPDTSWRGLGEIAEHLYLEKARSDGNYDVKAFTSRLQLANVHPRDATFFIGKDEDFRTPFKVFVDGQPYFYFKMDDGIRVEVPIRSGESRKIVVQYDEDFDLRRIDVSKRSWRIAALRYLSDYRDNVVSRSAYGRKLIQEYTENEHAWNEVAAACFSLLLIAPVLLVWVRSARAFKK